ncbi:uncharacterized protein LOC129905365 [Episyrphus balteatus]|uniref:uncharacterized protein LOC129905365 n=1 Tax=Episyrphus balteatus TaxID=286459 RepID=UPI0024868EB5|nr:uncharacterized protein LOC129905365 [Episyrphus balteatus]
MEEIWMNACRKLEISDDIARTWYEKIRRKMVQGSGRFYHNWDELLLRKKDYLDEMSSPSATILFAVFFQYYEFDGKRNCVEKNCEAFQEFCSEAGLKDENIIKLTKKLLGDESIDTLPGYDEEINLLQDLDLLVLGSPPEEYNRYRELLRKEYSHLDDASYKKMRLKVLETFLMIPTIFATNDFQSKFEETARKNIIKEIEELKN